MNNDSSNLPTGALLQGGKYRIIEVLGQGGFGITYLAEQTGLGMKVAIKEFFLKGSCTRDSSTSEIIVPVTDNKDTVARCLKKFKSEARKIASLNNDHIVNIIDMFDENGTSYYVMKYLNGGSLSKRVNGMPLDERDAIKIVMEICDALDAVHKNGLLHLDVKPANILFDEKGRAVLIDFGVSKYVDSQKDTATTSSLVGYSRGYAPLEQMNAVGSTLTPASDIYALGATLFSLVTGDTPPEASVIMNAGFPKLPDELSDEVKEAIRQSMQPRRKDRPQDISSFMYLLPEEDIKEEEDETVVAGAVDNIIQPAPTKHSKLHLILSAAMLAGAIVFFALSFHKPAPVTVSDGGLKEQYKAATEKVEKLQTQVNTLNSKVTSLEKSNSELKNLNSSITNSNNKLQSENNSLKKKVDELKATIANL